MKILFFTHLYPNDYEPMSGIFNLQRISALEKEGFVIRVVSPLSIFPPMRYFMPLPKIKKILHYIYTIWRMKSKQAGITRYTVEYLKWLSLPQKYFWVRQPAGMRFSFRRRLSGIIKEFNPDLIIASPAHPEGTYAKYFKEEYNIPVISIAEGSELLVYPEQNKGIEKIAELLNTYCSRVICISKLMADIAVKKYSIRNSIVIPNCYDDGIFYYTPSERKKENRFHVISTGNLNYVKGHDLLLCAIKNMPEFKLTIIGSGSLYNEYSEFIKNNNLSSRVFLKGYIEPGKLKDEYSSAGLFCLPSRSEGFGAAAVEALACGLPVIAPEVGIMPEIIRNGINGYLISRLTIENLENTLLLASQTGWDYDTIAQSAAAYTSLQWISKMKKLFNEVCGAVKNEI